MKYLLIPIFALFIMGNQCTDTDHTVSGSVSVDAEYSKAVMRQVNGINYFGESLGGVITDCMALDPSALYEGIWQEIIIQNENRTTPYTQEELDNCR